MTGFPEQFLIELRPSSDPWQGGENPKAWKASVLGVLVAFTFTDAGMALLRSIKAAGLKILIEPTLWNECHAHGGTRPNKPKAIGVVKIDISTYMKGSACFTRRGRDNPAFNRGFLPGEVLFHELIHAHRRSQGLGLESPDGTRLGGGLARYTDEEEFLAVVMTNIYISDDTNRTKSGLRADHRNGRPLERCLDTSLEFFQSSTQVLPLLTRFKDQQPKLFEELAAVKASFNPFAAMLKHGDKIAELSRSAFARTRDRVVPGRPVPKQVIPPPPPLLDVIKSVGTGLAQEALRILEN